MKLLISFAMLCVFSFTLMASDRANAAEPAVERQRPRSVAAGGQKPIVEEPVLGKPANEKQANEKQTGGKPARAKDTVENKAVENKAGEPKSDAKPAQPPAKALPPLDLEAIVQPLRALFGVGPVAARPPALAPGAFQAENAAGLEAQLNALNEQYVQQLMPIRSAELAFVRLLCSDLTPDQRRKIKSHADAGLKSAARRMADQQNQQRGNVGRPNANAEPQKLIRDAIALALKDTLTEEQWVRYTVEADARAAIRKRIAIESVVSRMDDQLLLTPDQREKVTQAIASKWQPQWEKWVVFSQTHGDRYFPVVPDPCITPHLTAEQKSVWQGIQKVDVGWWMHQTQENVEDDWWNLPSDKADDQPGNLRFQPTEIFR